MAVSRVSQREIVEVTYYRTDEVIASFNNFVKKDYFDAIMNKVILSMFDIELQ